MPSITIELTDEEYQTAQALPKSEQRRALLVAANSSDAVGTNLAEQVDQIKAQVSLDIFGPQGKD